MILYMTMPKNQYVLDDQIVETGLLKSNLIDAFIKDI